MTIEAQRLANFIGRGWAFPARIDTRGGVALVAGDDEIEASLRMILGTALGERVMRPEFGCAIWDLVFAPVNATTLGQMRQAVEQALGRWEPRIELRDATPAPDPEDPSRVIIALSYVVKATNDLRNLVFPFYVIPREEGEE